MVRSIDVLEEKIVKFREDIRKRGIFSTERFYVSGTDIYGVWIGVKESEKNEGFEDGVSRNTPNVLVGFHIDDFGIFDKETRRKLGGSPDVKKVSEMFVPEHIHLRECTRRNMIDGVRLLTEVEAWALENGKLRGGAESNKYREYGIAYILEKIYD